MTQSDLLVILGNGPSLKGFDLERFRPFDVIGMNAAYRYWDQVGWYPDYYICLDLVVGVSHKDAITRLIREREKNGIRRFFLRRNLIDLFEPEVRKSGAVVEFDALRESLPLFAPDSVTTGSHAALVGAMLGYARMILMGIDCNYVEQVDGAVSRGGKVLEIESAPCANPNYFFDGYQQKGDLYNVPNPRPDLHVSAWRDVAPILARRGVTVWNGSSISRVDAFPFRDFADLERSTTNLVEKAGWLKRRSRVLFLLAHRLRRHGLPVLAFLLLIGVLLVLPVLGVYHDYRGYFWAAAAVLILGAAACTAFAGMKRIEKLVADRQSFQGQWRHLEGMLGLKIASLVTELRALKREEEIDVEPKKRKAG